MQLAGSFGRTWYHGDVDTDGLPQHDAAIVGAAGLLSDTSTTSLQAGVANSAAFNQVTQAAIFETVVDDAYGALPQRNAHANASGTQESPVIARLAGGGFVTGWLSNSSFYVQRYDAQGVKVGAEQAIASGVFQPALVGLSGGGFAAAWQSGGVFVQTFDASGTAISAVFAASTATPSNQMQQPTLGAAANNGLVIAWSDTSGDGVGKIKVRVFDSAGTGHTGEIVVAAGYPYNNFFPKISVQADGDFIVAWTGSHTAPSGETFSQAANARLYDALGNPKSGVVSSNDFQSVPGFHDGFYESVATLTSGGFVMTWTDSTGNGTTIRGQLYGADGALIGAQFQVNPGDGLAAGQSSVAALDNGGFVVTWRPDTTDGGPNYFQHGNILGQAFDASGAKTGSVFLINNVNALGQDNPAVTAFGSGDFAVVWHTWTSAGETDVAIRTFYSTINGTLNAELLTGTPNTDYINGLGGIDTLVGLGSGDVLDGGDGDDTLYSRDMSGGYNAPYYGNPWTAPTLDTGIEADTLVGGDGNDRLFAGYGDNVDGGAGFDFLLISFQGASAGVTVDFRQNTNIVGGATITNVEGVDWVEGSNFDDDITMPGTSASSVSFAPIFGLGGNDHLVAGYYTGYMDGGDGNDVVDGRNSGYLQTVIGGAGDDTLYTNTNSFASALGGDGNDTIYAHGTIDGGAGNDTIYIQGSSYAGQVHGGDGDDTIFTAPTQGHSAVFGDAGKDTLTGGTGADTLDGGDDNDTIDGGAGANTLRGGAGNDRLVVSAAGSGTNVDGGADFDTLAISSAVTLGSIAGIEAIELTAGSNLTLSTSQVISGLDANTQLSGNGTITINLDANVFTPITGFQGVGAPINFVFNGSAGDDYVKAAHFTNTINGGQGRDFIRGGNGVDTIDGGADNDKITGWGGADILTGGSGSDQFRYFAASDSGLGAASDRITDFTIGSDVIDLRLLDKDLVTPDIQNYALSFIGSAAFGAGGTSQIRYATSGADMLVQFDLDGNGTSDMEIVLQGLAGQTLTVNDFLGVSAPTLGGSDAPSGFAASDSATLPVSALLNSDPLIPAPLGQSPMAPDADPAPLDPLGLLEPQHGFGSLQHADLLHLV